MKKKILFFGTPEIAVPSLKSIAALADFEIVGVGVFPDRKIGRKQIVSPCPVKVAALNLELPIYEINSKTELKALFKTVPCDLAIVIAFGLIFPLSVLNTPPLGVVNVHFSLLPRYRGSSPVQAAILNGNTHSGITWQRMVKGLDAGDILWQTQHQIGVQTTATVWLNFSKFTAKAFPDFLKAYTQKQITPRPQNQSEATFCGKFAKSDGHLSHQKVEAETIYNTWRAFTPWPGVSLKTGHGFIKIVDCALRKPSNGIPLTCANNTTLWLKVVQIPGKNPQTATQILVRNPQFFVE